jgi:hypothetical protein
MRQLRDRPGTSAPFPATGNHTFISSRYWYLSSLRDIGRTGRQTGFMKSQQSRRAICGRSCVVRRQAIGISSELTFVPMMPVRLGG